MTKVRCSECGTELDITKKNAFKQIRKHIKTCKATKRQVAMAVGYHLSKMANIYG